MLQWISKNRISFIKIAARMFILFVAIFCIYKIFSPAPTLAASVADPDSTLNQGVQIIQEPLGLPATDIRLIIMRIIRAAFGLVGIVMVVLIIYAGFLWMTAGGNDEQIGKAKKIIINATIGLAIMLSAVAIVSFVINMLGVKGGIGGNGGEAGSPNTENFIGSGSLGRIIRDHYPTRDQQAVPRNTKIIITFNYPVVPASFIQNTNQSKDANGNQMYGDCTGNLAKLNWKTDCDQLIMDDQHINISRSLTQNNEIVLEPIANGATVLASYVTENNNQRLYTIILRPNDYLGSDQEEISYTVHLGSAIKLDDPANPDKSIFDSAKVGNNYYEWPFTCSKELDETPPRVLGIYPTAGVTVVKNTAIQIEFSEPMDPTGMQGPFLSGTNYYVDSSGQKDENKSYIYLKPSHSSVPIGNFKFSNNFKTLEFISTKECGKNACGNSVYCLPVCDLANSPCPEGTNVDNYRLLLKAGITSANSWEAIPFTGITDASGNALDSEPYGTKNIVPLGNPLPAVFPGQEKPDNYFWNFNVKDEKDITSPYLIQIAPGLDAENVKAGTPLTMEFSKTLLVDSMYSIDIQEKPTHNVPIWKLPTINKEHTKIDVHHGNFLEGLRQYYFPVIDSRLVDVNYNCFYPGKGPGGAVEVSAKKPTSSRCENNANCCAVVNEQNAAYCCNGLSNSARATTDACLKFLKDPANSPD